jgi:AraC-like DNA-binding protein
VQLDGPSAVVQPAGAAHSDLIGAQGLEVLAITFDPHWLEPEARAALPPRTQWRQGGAIGVAIRHLTDVWLAGQGEASVRRATSRFLITTADIETPRAPRWGEEVLAALRGAARTDALARTLSRHPAWLARAFRAWRGEGLGESLRRRRVERATLQLRDTLDPLAQIAAEAGFCDQAHMNRCFRAVLARTPLEVRREAALLAPLSPAGA